MFSRCIFCHTAFSANEAFAHVPLGTRLAYDPARGRLWIVCSGCQRWTLTPIEERWEALEEVERAVTDRGRLLSQTENIALIRVPPVDIVRVGRARLVEEAWWRYGRELQQRNTVYRRVNWLQTGASVVVGMSIGWWFAMFSHDTDVFNNTRRWLRFGTVAWRGSVECSNCGAPLKEIPFDKSERLVLHNAHDGGVAIGRRCRRCRAGYQLIEGAPAHHTLRRVLAYQHFSGASEKRVRAATDRIDHAGSPELLVQTLAQSRPAIRDLRGKKARTDAIALEIALNDAVERTMLEVQLRDLEAHWRAEEELAAIVDGELTPLPPLEALRRRLGIDRTRG